MAHHLPPPAWLETAFLRCWVLVKDAHVGTLDEAFGRPWPKHTRLDRVRRRRELRTKVHGAVWGLIKADPGRSITRVSVFDEVGEMRGISLSGSEAEKLYYEAIKEDKALNVNTWRRAHLRERRPSHDIDSKVKDEGLGTAAKIGVMPSPRNPSQGLP